MKTAEAEAGIIINGEAFSVSNPVPGNQRLISISGVIPACDAPTYCLFEKFLWTLVGLDRAKTAPIMLFINSYGGSADSFFSFYDFTAMIESPIYTVANKAESAAALMFILGTKGRRYIFPGGYIALHDCRVTDNCDCEEDEKEKKKSEEGKKLINLYNRRVAKIIDQCTSGKMLKLLGDWRGETDQRKRNGAILSLLMNDVVLTAKEAIKYGAADHIITRQKFADLVR